MPQPRYNLDYQPFKFEFLNKNLSTDPNIVGAGQAWSNSIANARSGVIDIGGAAGDAVDAVGDLAGGAAGAGGAMSKFSKGLDAANKFVAPIQAVGGAISLGFDIYNQVQANKRANEQLDMVKKNYNLELEKAQKQEASYNKLAATIDKAWGGEGKIADTIDYSKYATDITTGGLKGGGGYIQGNDSSNARSMDSANASTASSNELGGSGAMPMATNSGALQPVGYSESVGNENSSDDTEESA